MNKQTEPSTPKKASPEHESRLYIWTFKAKRDSKMIVASIAEELDKNGFVIVPQILPFGIVDSLIQQIEALVEADPSRQAHGMRHLMQTIPAVRQIVESDSIQNLIAHFFCSRAFCVRSLFFDKTPEANWKVAWHQDLTIEVEEKLEVAGFSGWSIKDGGLHVQPPVAILEKMITVRLHLDDCDSSNGPLQVVAGSNQAGRLDTRQIDDWRKQSAPTTCIVPRGGALLMRPLLLHASSKASHPGHRRVVHLEFAAEPLRGGLQWRT